MQCSIRCRNVGKQFSLKGDGQPSQAEGSVIADARVLDGVLHALTDISFDLEDGDRLGIIGNNGAGKSTLLRIISGIMRPTSGSVEVSGRITSVQEHSSLLFPELTGRENILMMHRTAGKSSADAQAAVAGIDEFSGLGRMLDEAVKTYSSGMILRLTLGIIQAIRPEILILDEALSAGDATFRQRSQQMFDDLAHQARIMLFTSHQMQDIVTHCNKCMVLEQGRITYFGNVADAVSSYYGQAYNVTLNADARIADIAVTLSPDHSEFTPDEAIEVCVQFKLHEAIATMFPVITLFGAHGPLLSDSPVYHPDGGNQGFGAGVHTCRVTLPKHTFNMGEFSLSLTLGDGERIFVQVNNAANFRIVPGSWERNSPWQTMEMNFPMRPKLQWEFGSA